MTNTVKGLSILDTATRRFSMQMLSHKLRVTSAAVAMGAAAFIPGLAGAHEGVNHRTSIVPVHGSLLSGSGLLVTHGTTKFSTGMLDSPPNYTRWCGWGGRTCLPVTGTYKQTCKPNGEGCLRAK